MRLRLASVAALSATAVALPLAAPAVTGAARSAYRAAPAYPNTRLAIKVKGRPRAGRIATVVVTGAVERRDPPISYGLELFVQDPRVIKKCPAAYGGQLNNVINLTRHISQIGRNLNAGDGGRFRIPVKYETGTTRRVLFCAYLRFVTDDAAVSALFHTYGRPAPARRR
jgi:hypothetical protein